MGLWHRLLDVDVTRDRIGEYKVPEAWADRYVGGKGLAARILLEEYDGHDPLSPENLLIYMTGPLVGQLIGGSGRHLVVTHSPLTGFFGEAYCGGFWGSEFKRTGYDGLLVRGRAEHPVYLTVFDDGVELHDAADLWGKTVGDTEDALRERHGKGVRVSCIGPAGENLVRFAAIMNDRNRANARGGVGAVMGSKGLKAVVTKGNRAPPCADPKAFNALRKAWTKTLVTEGMKTFGKYGTAGGVETLNEMGILPTKNFQAGRFANPAAISGETMVDTILVARDTCTACPVVCKREVETAANGGRVTPDHGGPEYETIAAFGSLHLNDKLEWIALENQLCNEYGLDTISTGNVIAYAMEASERGLLEEAVPWGDAAKATELIHRIARREGLGDALAEGVKRFSERIGGEDFAVHVKGSEVPMHEPRGKKGLAISYAVTPRGANHMEGFHDTLIQRRGAPDLGVEPMDRFAVEGKGTACKAFEDARSFVNCQILCVFDVSMTGDDANLPLVRRLLGATLGREVDRDEMFAVGERAYNLARIFALRQGLRRRDDDLPKRFKTLALPYGKRKEAIPDADLRRMLDEYYAARGWDVDGRPTPETVRRLDLDVVT
jgi:aldehyde:ferredoxin oxidoreductase